MAGGPVAGTVAELKMMVKGVDLRHFEEERRASEKREKIAAARRVAPETDSLGCSKSGSMDIHEGTSLALVETTPSFSSL